MSNPMKLHDEKYKNARAAGAFGWGGAQRISNLSKTIDFSVCDATDLSYFENESFDILYDGNCFHCIIGERREYALSEWKRVLIKDGLLFISSLCSPNKDSNFPIEFDPIKRLLHEAGEPYRFIPTPECIKLELNDAGFRIVNTIVRIDHPFGHINIHAVKP